MSAEDEKVAEVEDEGEAIRVFVRVRPLNKREMAADCKIYWQFNETSMIEETQNGQRLYAYDAVFGLTSENQVVYNIVGKPIVLKAMEGFNGTVFTYGQTGSGKTWTMRGSPSDPGMMILCIRDILDWTHSHTEVTFKLTVAYMEVYNEEINDLLGDGGPDSKNLKIVSEDNIRGAIIGNLQEDVVTTHEDFLEVLRKGEANRSYASTTMNADSSRSHVIYRVTIEAYEKEEPTTNAMGFTMAKKQGEPIRISYLNLVDLAGSERQKSTNATGKTLKEGANINKSLLALGAVINKLGEASNKKGKKKGEKEAFIPYRDSKLTRILKQSLGGNTMTSILCATSPADESREETVSTLKFGQLCKTIKNIAKSNEIIDDKTLMKNLKTEIAKLKEENEELKAGATGGGGEFITRLKSEKRELEERLSTLESMMMDGVGGSEERERTSSTSADDPSASSGSAPPLVKKTPISSSNSSTMSLYASLKEAKEALNASNEKLSECQRRLIPLEKEAAAYSSFKQIKEEFEEYEVNKRQEFDDERAKMDTDKNKISIEKYELLKKEKSLDEKEAKIGALLATLDEQDSRLRQYMQTMKDQQANLLRSVSDLQRREDLVDEWQKSHRQKEMKLHEYKQSLDDRYNELGSRDNLIMETEHKWLVQQREFSEREQRLQIALSRLSNSEQALVKSEENLARLEIAHKKREHECDLKERELQVRRRELESLDSLLREKDRKISIEQRMLDEREDSVRSREDKFRHREMDVERKVNECKLSESHIQDMIESYNVKNAEFDQRDKVFKSKTVKIQRVEEELMAKENELSIWENSLQQMQERMQGIDEKENEIKEKIENHKIVEYDFFQTKVAGIAARHTAEMAEQQTIIDQQTQIIFNFQRELEKAKEEISIKTKEYDGLLNIIHQSEEEAKGLKDELFSLSKRVKNENFSPSRLMGTMETHHHEEEDESLIINAVNLEKLTDSKAFVLRSQRLGNSVSYTRNASNNFSSVNQNPANEFVDSSDDDDDDSDDGSDVDSEDFSIGGGGVGNDAFDPESLPNSKNQSYSKKSKKQSKKFMTHMLEFQKILFNILKKYRLLPGKNEPLLAARSKRQSCVNSQNQKTSSSTATTSNQNSQGQLKQPLSTAPSNAADDELSYFGGSAQENLEVFNMLLNKMQSKENAAKQVAAKQVAATTKRASIRQESSNNNASSSNNNASSSKLGPEEYAIYAKHEEYQDLLGNMPTNFDLSALANNEKGSIRARNKNYKADFFSEAVEEKASQHVFLRDAMARNVNIYDQNSDKAIPRLPLNHQNDSSKSSINNSNNNVDSSNAMSAGINRERTSSSAERLSRRREASTFTIPSDLGESKAIASTPDVQQSSDNKGKGIDLSKSMHDPPGSSKSPTAKGRKSIYLNANDSSRTLSPGKKSPIAKHVSKIKQENQIIKDNPDINDFVNIGVRDGIPVAKIALDMGGTKKIVNYVVTHDADV